MFRRPLLVLVACALTAGGCSSPGGVQVTLDEYTLKADPVSTAAGSVTFRARNVGAIAHQLIVLRTERDPDDLPVRGGLVRTKSKQIDIEGELELIAAASSENLSVTLDVGRYVLICNIAGHYDLGMRAAVRVTG